MVAVKDEATKEKAEAFALKGSHEDLKEKLKGEKVAFVEASLASFRSSTEYMLKISTYFYSGFEAFHRRASRMYLEIDFSGFIRTTTLVCQKKNPRWPKIPRPLGDP